MAINETLALEGSEKVMNTDSKNRALDFIASKIPQVLHYTTSTTYY